MSEIALLFTCLLALGGVVLANLGCRVLRDFSRHDLEEICRRRERTERFGEILRLHDTVALGVEALAAVLTALALIAGTAWASARWQALPVASVASLLAWALVGGIVIAAVRTWIPWAASRVFAEPFLYHTWPAWRALAASTVPLTWGAQLCDAVLHRIVGRTRQPVDEQQIEEEIRTIVTEGHREGLLEEHAREMIEGVIELGDADVSQIMTPRTDMHMLSVDTPWDEMIADAIEVGHTRIPVFGETRDDVVGILYIKDLLPELASGDPARRKPLAELVRKPLFVPETKPVDDLLEMFQQLRTHIAVVLDEYGGVSGLVSIEDVLEEIVGEIVDEYDPEHVAEIQQLDGDTCEALGRTHVDEINEAMGLELPEDGDFDTIGGFVFTEIGRVPQPGETVTWQDQVRISVLEATRRRIDRVRIERLDESEQRESA